MGRVNWIRGRLRYLLIIPIIFCMLHPSMAYARLPYNTSFVDQQTGRTIKIQPLYIPSRVIEGEGLDVKMSSPSDLFITDNDHVFVADTGNNRIVELNEDGGFVRSFGAKDGAGKLDQPEGVFVTPEGRVYVADTGNKRIAVFKPEGTFEREFARPNSSLLPKEYYFVPSKLVVDSRGVMYINSKGSYEGLMRMGPDGSFRGFFGANITPLSWLDRLKRLVLTKKQLEKEAGKQPGTIQNVTLGNNGFIYETNNGVRSGQIRKLNGGGFDVFDNRGFPDLSLVDVAVDRNDFLYSLDLKQGDVTIYDPFGNALFHFGSEDNMAHQYGIVSFPAGMAVNSKNEIWIADNRMNLIQVFKRTPFGDAFLRAANLYYGGSYEASKPYWEEVMKQNGMMNISFNAMGRIAFHEKKYSEALGYFKDSYDSTGYSKAFWEIRYEWIQRYLLYAAVIIAAGIWLARVAVRRIKPILARRDWPAFARRFAGEAKDAMYLIIHPYEGFYRLKERKVSWSFLISVLALVAVIKVVSIYGMGFIFHPYDMSRVNLSVQLLLFFVPWATWILANYLVSAVKGGEGRFREVLQASVYALVPYIVLMIPAIAVSNIVVLEERILVDTMTNVMILWMLLLFFIMTQVIHNFDFLESIKNSMITLCTIGVIWIFGIILSGLSYNLFDFLQQIYREVTYHG